jgi:hypothetical protein
MLTSAAAESLGKTSPELFKLRLGDCLVAATEDEYYTAANALVRSAQWGETLDPVDVLVTVDSTHPVDLANWMTSCTAGDMGNTLARRHG